MGLLDLGYTEEQLALLSDEELVKLSELIEAREHDIMLEMASNDFLGFSKYIEPDFNYEGFYEVYYTVLNLFAMGIIKRLIISVPPQHGKSHGSTRKLPAYMFGKNPNIRMAIGSYSADLSKDFNSDIQKIIDSPEYHRIFPETMLSGSPYDKTGIKGFSRTREQFEILKKKGILYSIGRGGGLTGKTIDLAILDDLYKNYEEANSPIVREEAINFYKSVIRTRAPKQELIVFTRWHEEDLIGYIESKETVVTLESLSDLDNIPDRAWVKINFEALKDSEPTDIDPRKHGEALVEFLHSKVRLEEEKKLDKENFECLYQGNPVNKEGLMYGEFATYDTLPQLRIVKCETDTADKGTDYFCAVVYGLPLDWNDDKVYVLDVMYTKEPMEVTEPQYINLLNRWRVNEADIESNNGGRGFSRSIEKFVGAVINQRYQTGNKESRIFSNRAKVNRDIVFPLGWEHRFDKFHSHITKFKKFFKANKTDDGCFIAGTMISTLFGNVPIEKIKVGDYIITPVGIRKVIDSGKTGNKEVINNLGLTGTPTHKVFNVNKFSDLMVCNQAGISILQYKKILLWKYKTLLLSMELNIDSWGRENIILANQKTIKEEKILKDFMLRFGNFIIKKKFQTAFVFIIKTMMFLISTLIIWSVYQLSNICRIMLKKIMKMKFMSLKIKRIWNQLDTKHQNGIRVKKDENGTKKWQKVEFLKRNNLLVKIVGTLSYLFTRIHCFVVKVVGVNSGIKNQKLNMQENVLSAEKNLNPKKQKNNKSERLVQNHVLINSITKTEDVYNITVEDAGCYYANGILVSNCDVLTAIIEKKDEGFRVEDIEIYND